MPITNPGWAGYFTRTYTQLKQNILTRLQSRVQEITDHTETNPWVKAISIWSALVEMLGYYIDNAAREFYLVTGTQEYSTAIKIARLFNYRVKGAFPASVTLRFTLSEVATGQFNIPIGTQCETSTGEVFLTTTLGTINIGETFIDVEAKQWEVVTNVALGNSNGAANQIFLLEENVADGSVTLTVDALNWTAQDTFAFSIPTDEHYVAQINKDEVMYVEFGDDINGAIPQNGSALVANYYTTLGSSGNVGANTINSIVSVVTVPNGILTVNNSNPATGGTGVETLTQLKKRIPLSLRTRYRAVTEQDFIDICELFTGVEKAGVLFDCDVDKYVNIYIAPVGGGLASNQLLSDLADYIETRRIITVQNKFQTVGVLDTIINANVQALSNYSNAVVKDNVEQALLDFFQPDNQEIGGRLNIGDIFEVIEGTEGVDFSDVTLLVLRPFARPLTNTDNPLNWTRSLNATSSITTRWLLRFITISTFELYKEDVFQAAYAVDTLIELDELDFTVNGNHVAGEDYEFYTYPYNSSVDILEPSIAGTALGLLQINVSGGV